MASELERAARHVVVAVDGSEASRMAVKWAATHVLRPEDDLHLVKVPRDRVDVILLPVSEGAPNPGAALVAFANFTGNFKVLVVGSRGMGAFKKAVMALLGMGSVSSYVVQHAELPVAVVRQDLQLETLVQGTASPSRNICVAVDGSPNAATALEWALTNMLDPARDVLHLVSVAVPPPPPVADIGPATIVVMSYLEERQRAVADAQRAADAAVTVAMQRGVPDDRIVQEALDPLSDGAGTVSGSLIRYLCDHKVDDVVVGSRGLGTLHSAVLSMAGLGSISTECVQRAPCPVIVTPPPSAD